MSKTPFPWYFYLLTVRSWVLFVVLSIAFTYFSLKMIQGPLWGKLLGVLAVLIMASFVGGYFRILPFRRILGRITSLQEYFPDELRFQAQSQKDVWPLLEQILTLTEHTISEQAKLIEDKNNQASLMIESIPNAIVVIDKFETCVQYNQLFLKKFCAGREIDGRYKLWKIFEEPMLNTFRHCLQNNQQIRVLGQYFQGNNEYYDITVTPINNRQQKLTGALGIFHNVTQSKLNEKMRVDFVANVSHEIRTPLTSIKGYAQLLEVHASQVPPELVPILNKISDNVERLKDLFDNLLKLSVIESQYELSLESVDFNQLLTDVWANLKAKYLHREINLDNSFESIVIKCDPKLMEQALNNLLDNAIKYGKEKVNIQISGGEIDGKVRIQVKDNGPGIRHDDLNRIFERFFRVQGHSNKAIEGSGLGLSIVKHIVNKHRGQVEVESIVGEGTSFTMILPL